MGLEELSEFLDPAGVFPAVYAARMAMRVYRRVCGAMARARGVDSETIRSFEFAGFLIVLILCAQIRHHDTFEKDVMVEDCNDALEELYSRSITTTC